MINHKYLTLRDFLSHNKPTDSNYISVSKHNYKNPSNPGLLYEGPSDDVPDNILDLRIIAWLRKDGIYISE